jgi:hypothetical protein
MNEQQYDMEATEIIGIVMAAAPTETVHARVRQYLADLMLREGRLSDGIEGKDISWCEADGCQAATVGITCDGCEKDLTHERHAVLSDTDVVSSLCERCFDLATRTAQGRHARQVQVQVATATEVE